MRNPPSKNGLGTILTVPQLKYRLRHISKDGKVWRLKMGVTGGKSPQAYSEIHFHSSEAPDSLLKLSYRFPVFELFAFGEPEALICLHPSLAHPTSHGSYFEQGKWKRDDLADFVAFWNPLREVL
jgi:hypothetical protein